MSLFTSAGRRVAVLGLAAAALLLAQDWKALTDLPAVNFSGLKPLQKTAALRLMRNHDCSCGCGMKVAECRVNDPNCGYSKGIAAAMIEALHAGKDENAALAAANDSKWGKGPAPRKLLYDAVKIPTAGAPEKGAKNAKITLVEFSDFQCPYCYKASKELDAVLAAYPTQVKLIFKQFPLDMHSQAAQAARAAIAAHDQGKFWQMHDLMFAGRADLSRNSLMAMAQKAGLDMKKFAADLDSPQTRQIVAKDQADGDNAGVEGTPTVYINGQRYNGSLALGAIRNVLNAEK